MPGKQRRINQQQLELGVQYVQKQHLSIRKAAELANISKSSLHRKIMELQKQQAQQQQPAHISVISDDTPCISFEKQSDDSSDYSIFYDFVDLSSESFSTFDF